jgi:hypothetical protein
MGALINLIHPQGENYSFFQNSEKQSFADEGDSGPSVIKLLSILKSEYENGEAESIFNLYILVPNVENILRLRYLSWEFS